MIGKPVLYEDEEEQADANKEIETYLLIKASRYLGIPFYDLYKMPSYWRNFALMSEEAERKADTTINPKNNPLAGL